MLENDVGNEMFLEVSKDNHTIDSKNSPMYQFLEISYHWDLEYLFCGCLTTFSKNYLFQQTSTNYHRWVWYGYLI